MGKRYRIFPLAALFLFLLTSCGKEVTEIPGDAIEITLSGTEAFCTDPSVYIEKEKITLTAHGTYVVSGVWEDGQISAECVDAGEIELILNNAEISNDDGACIVFRQAQAAEITIADGSVNRLSDGAVYTFENPLDDEPDAALFSKTDLVISGNGTLVIDGNYKNGITSKDGLKIDGGTIEINSADHGIKGKDNLIINGGELKINALGDGIKSTNEESELVGYVEINGGSVNILSDDEGVQAVTTITVNGGSLTVDSTNNGIRCGGELSINGGSVNVDADDTPIDVQDVIVGEGAAFTVLGFPYGK
ncbi:MAG: carbohydrate-binding domain-containing protein [Ruminococcaceae bacterium]|nr:carbohydrate-binding domain-containing protein [Oscillospiraceae bacterium]